MQHILPIERRYKKYYGDEGNGFWVVAIYGKNIIWYNDIEDGYPSGGHASPPIPLI